MKPVTKLKQLTILLPIEELKILKKAAIDKEVSVSEFIRLLILSNGETDNG